MALGYLILIWSILSTLQLASYTMWKKESRALESIIEIQCYNLAKYIDGEKKYRAFIGKY